MKTTVLSFMLAVFCTTGCRPDPYQPTFTDNVGEAFEPCNSAEIKFLASKHNFMTAFANCGSNNFSHFAWSPSGRHLFFQLTHSSHVMDAEAANKQTLTIPTSTPVGDGGWLSNTQIAVPIAMADDPRIYIAVYNMEQSSLFSHPVDELTKISEIQRGRTHTELLFSATSDGETRHIYQMNMDTGEVTTAFSWLSAPMDTFTFTATSKRLVVASNNKTTLYNSEKGQPIGTWSPAHRGTIHPDGSWLALEHLGEPISIFYQRAWDELSEPIRRREIAKAKKLEASLPSGYPKTVNPPILSFVDMESGKRWQMDNVQGETFQWYEAKNYFGSLIVWGFENKQVNRNVVLGNFFDRFRNLQRGDNVTGVSAFASETQAP
jgi:hypothetical protein